MSWELYLFQLPMGYFNPKESAQGGILVNYLIAETKCPGGEKKAQFLCVHLQLKTKGPATDAVATLPYGA